MTWWTALLSVVPLTLLVWAVSFAGGALLAILVAAAKASRYTLIRAAATIHIEIFRGIPTLVWLFLVFFGLTSFGLISPTALVSAILTLSIIFSAYIAETYRSGLNAVPQQQREATKALGLPRKVAFVTVVLPQAKPIILAGMGSFGIHLLKETALTSLIGVVEIMNVANYLVERGGNGLSVFLVAGLIYMLLSLPIATGAKYLAQSRPARTTRKGVVQP